MHTLILESNTMLPEAGPEALDGTLWAKIAGSLTVITGLLYALFGKLRRGRAADDTETNALRTVDAAVEHWHKLYDVAWAQATKERELREAAERRGTSMLAEMEGLRSQVAALERRIEHMSAQLDQFTRKP